MALTSKLKPQDIVCRDLNIQRICVDNFMARKLIHPKIQASPYEPLSANKYVKEKKKNTMSWGKY